MTTNEKLDAVLQRLNHAHTAYFKSYPEAKGFMERRKYDYLTVVEIASSIPDMDEIGLILDYLTDVEKLIETSLIEQTVQYRILWKGKVFIENGGFVQTKKLLDSKILDDKNSRILTERTAIRLNRLTRYLAIGTMALVLVEIIRLLIEHNPFSCR